MRLYGKEEVAMGMERQDGRSSTVWDHLVMILCVFVMVLLLLMTSSSFTPDFHEVFQAVRWTGALVVSGIVSLQGHVL
jgi:hypothetical protein